MATTQDKRACPVCGTLLQEDGAYCPVCALRGALETQNDSVSDITSELRFEHYQVLRNQDGTPLELGHGGMGLTYKAVDTHLRCAVALKMISARFICNEAARSRFLREARAAASVHHPNVATVHHLGESGGNYFYAMEFVDGESVASLIRRSGRLEADLALEIVEQATAGLAGIEKQHLVHRDIKPSNIMVSLQDGRLETVKIIDLGLAKGVGEENTLSTVGAFIGTPAYASPEQFAGIGTDVRSDLYSLGVTLWEMVSGKLPFQGSALELMGQHQHAFPPIGQLKGVPAPIVSLLEILLEKDPDLRFRSAVELGKALARVREAVASGSSLSVIELRSVHKVIEQSPKGKPRTHTVRWRSAFAAGLAGLLLVLSVALSVRLLQRQQHSNRQLQALQVRFDKLQQSVNSFAEVQNEVRQEKPGQKPGEIDQRTYEELSKKLGIDAATLKEQLPRFAEELKKAPNATTYERANAAYVANDYNEAERLALAAADEAQRGGPAKNAEAVKALELAAWAAEKRVEYADALNRLRDAEKLIDRTRDTAEWARVQFAIAWVLHDQGLYGAAEHILREVLAERERTLGPEQPDTLATRHYLASALFFQGKYDKAETEYRAVLKLREKALGPEHPDTLRTRNNLALALSYQAKYGEAETEYRALLKLKEKVLGPEHPSTLVTRNGLADVLDNEGKYGEAETEYRALLKLKEKVDGPEHPDTLGTRNNLANALSHQGKYAEAEVEYRAVLQLEEKVLGSEHPNTLITRQNLAEALLDEGQVRGSRD